MNRNRYRVDASENREAQREAKHVNYYIQVSEAEPSGERFWYVDDQGNATRIDVCSEQPPFEARRFRSDFPTSRFHKLSLAPGEYYPRMARPCSIEAGALPASNPGSRELINLRTTSTGQLHALIGQLEQICRVVHPVARNYKAFGHEIRNVLILACTEVEAQWKGILKANSVNVNRASTNLYVKLAKPLKLAAYTVNLTYYPWLPPIAPFRGWKESGSPSQDLRWYQAYNQSKHDRESKFDQATLQHALHAVAGCFVILCAQYGDFPLRGPEALRAFFQLITSPTWSPKEIYTPFGDPKEIFYDFGIAKKE